MDIWSFIRIGGRFREQRLCLLYVIYEISSLSPCALFLMSNCMQFAKTEKINQFFNSSISLLGIIRMQICYKFLSILICHILCACTAKNQAPLDLKINFNISNCYLNLTTTELFD